MDLELSDDESALRDNVRSVLTGICPPSAVRAIHEGKGDGWGIWAQMVELSWPALAIAEEHGGLGMGFVEVAIVAEELGRLVVPGPFLATVTQFAPAVREVGALGGGGGSALAVDLLGRVAAGDLTGTVAQAEGAVWAASPAMTATATAVAGDDGGGWVLQGTKGPVLDGTTAAEVLVVAQGPDGLGAFVVPGPALTAGAAARPVVDPTLPIADLTLDGVAVPADRVLAAPGTPGVAEALERAGHEAVVALATATVGTCRAIFEQTVAYTKVREQFGRPIGSFQALKHRMADMYLALERAAALCYYAVLTISEDTPQRATAASMAKAAAGECQRLIVRDGLQLHGGIGYTWENDLHFLLKRGLAGDALYGSAVQHRALLARRLGLLPGDGGVGSATGAGPGLHGANAAVNDEEGR